MMRKSVVLQMFVNHKVFGPHDGDKREFKVSAKLLLFIILAPQSAVKYPSSNWWDISVWRTCRQIFTSKTTLLTWLKELFSKTQILNFWLQLLLDCKAQVWIRSGLCCITLYLRKWSFSYQRLASLIVLLVFVEIDQIIWLCYLTVTSVPSSGCWCYMKCKKCT